MRITFHVPGDPQGKGRARVGKVGGHVRMFTPSETVAYEGLIAMAASEAMRRAGLEPISGPVSVFVDAKHPMPRSWSKKRATAATEALAWHIVKPDSDNIGKAVGDGCNSVVWRDDCQIADLRVRKTYGLTPGLTVTVEVL